MGEGTSPLHSSFMFDAITPKEPEDMFKDTDQPVPPVMTHSPLSSTPAVPTPLTSFPQPSIPSTPHMSAGKIILFVVGTVAIIGVAGFISYYVLSAREPVVPTIVTEEPAGEVTQPVEEEPAVSEQPVGEEPQAVDTDKDGLTDEEEATLGTSPRSSDTDRDELYDYEEVNVYHTNPLSKDSDGDSYEDGVEITGGYDPNGPGKLLQLPSGE